MKLSKLYDDMMALIPSEDKWTKGSMGRDHSGKPIAPWLIDHATKDSPHICSRCLMGLVRTAAPIPAIAQLLMDDLRVTVENLTGSSDIVRFNDDTFTKFETVVSALKTAKHRAEYLEIYL